jgi:hypothetical protein
MVRGRDAATILHQRWLRSDQSEPDWALRVHLAPETQRVQRQQNRRVLVSVSESDDSDVVELEALDQMVTEVSDIEGAEIEATTASMTNSEDEVSTSSENQIWFIVPGSDPKRGQLLHD